MTHHELLRKLGETAGIELELSGHSTAAVKFDGDEVNFESDGGRLYVYADIASAEGREADFGRLLESNNLFAGTDGATIGLDHARGTFTLCRMIEGDAEYAAFERTVASFVTALRLVRREVTEGEVSSPEPQPGLDHLSDGPVMQV
jgi:hypothetical protein